MRDLEGWDGSLSLGQLTASEIIGHRAIPGRASRSDDDEIPYYGTVRGKGGRRTSFHEAPPVLVRYRVPWP